MLEEDPDDLDDPDEVEELVDPDELDDFDELDDLLVSNTGEVTRIDCVAGGVTETDCDDDA